MHTTPDFSLINALAAVGIALVYITSFSLVKEPIRQRLNALVIAGAGAIYWSSGFGIWEFPFCLPMLYCAYRGLVNYRFIGIGWLLHTAWDLAHHLYGNPIVPFSPSSSAGCAVCDVLLALWFFAKAPSVFGIFEKISNKPA